MAYVYALMSSKSGKRYVGSTLLDPLERLAQHNLGKVPWTKGHRPLSLIYSEKFSSSDLARKREKFFKSGKGRMVLNSLLNGK